ncbi:MAG TPA: tetratricopeptide repeat protein [Terriglobia bacterium]|nr:tetratricopeptide repeat protein [Terriglobia bacterium]
MYAPVRQHEFVAWDDPSYITENPRVAAGLTWEGVRWAFTTAHMANWHPLTWLSHMMDVQLFGLNAGAHHLVNLLFHVLNALLLFALLHRLLSRAPAALGISGFAAGLFALHPLHVESVAWVAERKDVLSALFFLLATLAYLGYARRPNGFRYASVLGLFALGLMAKPMVVTLPFVLLLLDLWPLRRLPWTNGAERPSGWQVLRTQQAAMLRLALEKLPLFGLAAASSALTIWAQQSGGAVAALEAFPLTLRLQNAVVSYVAYLGKTLWPAQLAAFYPYPDSLSGGLVAGSVLLLLAISYGSVRFFPRFPCFAVGWFWYVGMLLPVIGVVQVGGQPLADRYTYLPLIGIFLLLSCGMAALSQRWRPARAALLPAGAAILLACAVVARGQVSHWRNSIALWEHALRVTENNFTAHANLGHALLRAGRVAEAAAQYTAALRLRPDFADAHQGLGVALAKQENWRQAVAHYEAALRVRPQWAEVHNYLGAALAKQEQFGQAIAHYEEALRLRPDFADARNNLGAALASQGKYEQALRVFLEALRIKPAADVYYNVATMYEQLGDIPQAIGNYQAALRLDPHHSPARAALEELAGRGYSTRSSAP